MEGKKGKEQKDKLGKVKTNLENNKRKNKE